MLGFINNLDLKISDILNGCSVSEAENRKWVEDQVKLADETQIGTDDWNSTTGETLKVEHPEEYVGAFENGGYGVIEVFLNSTGGLAAFFNVNYTVAATTVRDFFSLSGNEAEFKRNSLGVVIGVFVAFEEKTSSIYFEKKVPTELLTESYLQQFVGDYDRGIEVTYTKVGSKISLIVDGALSVSTSYSDAELTPLKPYWFGLDTSYFEFVRANGVVKQLTIHDGDSYKILNKK